jgi:hypothetical protein
MEKKITYFEKPGKDNTAECVAIVKDASGQYKHVVVASTTGTTGIAMAEALSGVNLVVITHSYGFREPNSSEMPDEIKKRIESHGARVHTGTMVTHSLDTAFSAKFNGVSLTQIVANSLRRFGEGAKVGLECVMMAADSGLIPEREEVICVAGTAYGADTVMVVRSAASKRFLELKVLEILAKPRG